MDSISDANKISKATKSFFKASALDGVNMASKIASLEDQLKKVESRFLEALDLIDHLEDSGQCSCPGDHSDWISKE